MNLSAFLIVPLQVVLLQQVYKPFGKCTQP